MARLPSGFDQHIVEPAGLDLASDPLDSECLYAHNVVYEPGRVIVRDPFVWITSYTATMDGLATIRSSTGEPVFVMQSGPDVLAVNTSGTTLHTQATSNAPIGSAVFGSPTTNSLYLSRGTSQATLKYVPGTGFSTPSIVAHVLPGDPDLADLAAYPRGYFWAVWQDRLVVANTDAQGTPGTFNASRVAFSSLSSPDCWQENHYVDCQPGDGEHITGMVAWRDKLFVFKQTKYFVFYGTNADENGNPVFNKTDVFDRQGTLGIGSPVRIVACAGRRGVYYLSASGVYRTTGNEPVHVGAPIAPLFAANFLSEPALWPPEVGVTYLAGRASIAASAGRVCCAVQIPATSPTRPTFLVFDEDSERWSTWDAPIPSGTSASTTTAVCGMVPARTTGTYGEDERLAVAVNYLDGATAKSALMWVGNQTDPRDYAGGAYSSATAEYHTGLLDHGSTDEKVLREVQIEGDTGGEGSGTTVNVSVTTPYGNDTATTGRQAAFAVGPNVARHRKSYRGRWFQVRLSGTNFAVNRIITRINAAARGPGVDQA